MAAAEAMMWGRQSYSPLASPHLCHGPLDLQEPKGSCRLKILIFNLFGVVRISNTQSAQVSPGSVFSSYCSWKHPIIEEN